MRLLVLFLLLSLSGYAQDSLVKTIWFGPDSYELSPTLIAEIAGLKQKGLVLTEGKRLLIVGHTDNLKDSLSNMRLSEQRARTVADVLRKSGYPAESIFLGVFGANEPVGNNNSLSGRALNRRVEIKIGPALAGTQKTSIFSYSLSGTEFNSDTILLHCSGGYMLRFPPGSIEPSVASQLGFSIQEGKELIPSLIQQNHSTSSTSDRMIDLFLFLQISNPTSVSSSRTAYEILIPARSIYAGLNWYEEQYFKNENRWELIDRRPFPLIVNGTPYLGFLSTHLHSFALGKEPIIISETPTDLSLFFQEDADSVYLVYESDSIRRMYKFKPDGNRITSRQYLIQPYYSGMQPYLLVFSSSSGQSRSYRLNPETLIWSQRKKARLVRKKDLH